MAGDLDGLGRGLGGVPLAERDEVGVAGQGAGEGLLERDRLAPGPGRWSRSPGRSASPCRPAWPGSSGPARRGPVGAGFGAVGIARSGPTGGTSGPTGGRGAATGGAGPARSAAGSAPSGERARGDLGASWLAESAEEAGRGRAVGGLSRPGRPGGRHRPRRDAPAKLAARARAIKAGVSGMGHASCVRETSGGVALRFRTAFESPDGFRSEPSRGPVGRDKSLLRMGVSP